MKSEKLRKKMKIACDEIRRDNVWFLQLEIVIAFANNVALRAKKKKL